MLRAIKFWWQRRIRGWDDRDTWSLDVSIAQFILPRLKRLREISNGYPEELTEESWDMILDQMIESFEIVCDDEWYMFPDIEKFQKGFKLFTKYYCNLWW